MLRLSLFAGVFLFRLAAPAGEIAVLNTGFRLRAEKIESDGERIRLHLASGVVELDRKAVVGIEADPTPPAVPPPPPAAAPRAEPRPLTLREMVTQAALKNGLPPEFVHSVAAAESAYRTDAVSPKGALGVMQLMPATARALGADPLDPAQNIEAGARHLRDLLLQYQNDPNPVRRALAAYNAGPGAVTRYNGVPPYRETQAYVEKVIGRYWRQVSPPRKP
jgi:soluble lytic murein transglycosylase-like protein